MKFGPVLVGEAEDTLLAHSLRAGDIVLAKGHRLTATDVAALAALGVSEVVAVRLDANDLPEDEAAARIAAAITPSHLQFSTATTGRVNVHATASGLFVANPSVVDQVNRVDASITLACLADHVAVDAGDMVATIKIIPLAVSAMSVARAEVALRAEPAFQLKPFMPRRVALIATELPSLKRQVMDKTHAVLAARLARSGSHLVTERRVAHAEGAVAGVIEELEQTHELIVVIGASAVSDSDDVIPAAIRRAGGLVEHIGMPVDPGNLLVLGRIGDVPVVGAPGCARSPRENGFDWILNRLLAGERPSAHEISGLGVGGLMKEIPTRPRLREIIAERKRRSRVAIVVLAAGRASRMGPGGQHKLLAEFDGKPLVRRSVETALGAGAGAVVVVTGHRESEIRGTLADLPVTLASNPDYLSGMASSLVMGLSAIEANASGMMVMLADMPGITSEDLSALIAAFDAENGRCVVRAVSGGLRGNPVVLPRSTFSAVSQLVGDVGARYVLEQSGLPVIDVELGAAARLDVDTPEATIAAGGTLRA
ncbi:molybdopterin-binding/nucleotidyl transferase protein (plasmid) [Rhizobium etli bv. mimosae str. IE4771]|uniref:Molybdopterin-binding/nucleotidyl transferase protein n=1 Tax=Rhizobium etli bv. mimosae str. IE4771 TaxID=1432050 RepID=A0A060ICM9_RHIET|nr:NTP transferase domain-containing protein [Rhizobium sp. IE4771]AIC29825.1 molybdopterin-binding/nucleotidyl transferase protein [Rhizobium sp. IE4771]